MRVLAPNSAPRFHDSSLLRAVRSATVDRAKVGRPEHKPALFLDRDGVLNATDPLFIDCPENLDRALFPEALEALARLQLATGMPVIVVSNQAWVDQGRFSEDTAFDIQSRLAQRASEAGARLDAVYFSPNFGEYVVPEGRVDARKAEPGMFWQAQEDFGDRIDLADSYLVGDMSTDLRAAENAHEGMRRILVETGCGGQDGKFEFSADHVAKDLPAAVDWILQQEQRSAT